jgi:hypothetical protein
MSISELQGIGTLTLEGAASLLLAVVAFKLYRARVTTHSGCCGDSVVIDTSNPGAEIEP